jgi:8-oxo-dGTP pyrophosphatase MutT (NUDIX family)
MMNKTFTEQADQVAWDKMITRFNSGLLVDVKSCANVRDFYGSGFMIISECPNGHPRVLMTMERDCYSKGPSHGKFVFRMPGGRRDVNETALETAMREMKEELSLFPPHALKIIGCIVSPPPPNSSSNVNSYTFVAVTKFNNAYLHKPRFDLNTVPTQSPVDINGEIYGYDFVRLSEIYRYINEPSNANRKNIKCLNQELGLASQPYHFFKKILLF